MYFLSINNQIYMFRIIIYFYKERSQSCKELSILNKLINNNFDTNNKASNTLKKRKTLSGKFYAFDLSYKH